MAIYVEANKRIELISEIVYVLMAKVAPIFSMLPKSFVCLFVYFTTDLESEALVLPIPMWFAYIFDDFFFSFLFYWTAPCLTFTSFQIEGSRLIQRIQKDICSL